MRNKAALSVKRGSIQILRAVNLIAYKTLALVKYGASVIERYGNYTVIVLNVCVCINPLFIRLCERNNDLLNCDLSAIIFIGINKINKNIAVGF